MSEERRCYRHYRVIHEKAGRPDDALALILANGGRTLQSSWLRRRETQEESCRRRAPWPVFSFNHFA